jgi:hypothetical protein
MLRLILHTTTVYTGHNVVHGVTVANLQCHVLVHVIFTNIIIVPLLVLHDKRLACCKKDRRYWVLCRLCGCFVYVRSMFDFNYLGNSSRSYWEETSCCVWHFCGVSDIFPPLYEIIVDIWHNLVYSGIAVPFLFIGVCLTKFLV